MRTGLAASVGGLGLAVLIAGAAAADGAFQGAGVFPVSAGGVVSLELGCAPGGPACEGKVTLTSAKPIVARRDGPKAVRTLARTTYEPIPAGTTVTVKVKLAKAARLHVLGHATTRALIAFDPPVALPASGSITPLPDRVTLRLHGAGPH